MRHRRKTVAGYWAGWLTLRATAAAHAAVQDHSLQERVNLLYQRRLFP